MKIGQKDIQGCCLLQQMFKLDYPINIGVRLIWDTHTNKFRIIPTNWDHWTLVLKTE